MNKIIISLICILLISALNSTETAAEQVYDFQSWTLNYTYQAEYQHMMSWQIIAQSSIHNNIYYAFDVIPVFWTYRDRFLKKDRYSDNIGLGSYILLLPLGWFSQIWDKDALWYAMMTPNSGLNYFPVLGKTKNLGLCGFGLYTKLNSAAYVFHSKKWLSFTPSCGISLIVRGIKLNIGYDLNYETNFDKTYKIPSWTFSIEIMGLENVQY